MRTLVAIVAAAMGVALPAIAHANPGGLPGYTGKPTTASPQGESCNQCHSGGTAPTVALAGPASLTAGQVADYTLTVTTGLAEAGAGIAATDGIVLTPVTGLRDSFGEMVQSAPLTVSGGTAVFKFKVTAPATGTAIKLWAVGLAANGANGNQGDKATHTTKDITITGGTAPAPDAGPTTDAGSSGSMPESTPPSPSADPGATPTQPGTGTTPNEPGTSTDPNEPAGDPNAEEPGAPVTYGPRRGNAGPDAGGCNAGAQGVADASLLAIVSLLGLAIRTRRKRCAR